MRSCSLRNKYAVSLNKFKYTVIVLFRDGKCFRDFNEQTSPLWHICHRFTTTGPCDTIKCRWAHWIQWASWWSISCKHMPQWMMHIPLIKVSFHLNVLLNLSFIHFKFGFTSSSGTVLFFHLLTNSMPIWVFIKEDFMLKKPWTIFNLLLNWTQFLKFCIQNFNILWASGQDSWRTQVFCFFLLILS